MEAVTTGELLQGMSLAEYISMFGSITDQNPDNKKTFKKRIPFTLWGRQEEVCDNIELALRALLPKSRQKGYSELAAERCLKTLFEHENIQGAVISKSEDFAKHFLKQRIMPKYNTMRENFPQLNFPKIIRSTNEEIEWEGGRILKSISCSSTAAASLTLDFLVVDEAGGIDEGRGKMTEEDSIFKPILNNSIPALDQNQNAWLMVIGTSVPGSYYNKLVREAYDEQNEGVFKYFFIGWHDQPGRDIAWYRNQHALLGNDVFLQHPADMDDFFFIKDGLVFQHFDPKEGGRHVIDFTIGEKFYRKRQNKIERLRAHWNLQFLTSYDHGTSHPAVNEYALYDEHQDMLYIFGETFFQEGHGADASEIADAIRARLKKCGKMPSRMVADGAIFNDIGAGLTVGSIFRKKGLSFRKAKKSDERASRELLNDRIRECKIVFHSSCHNTIDQIRDYRWDPKSKGDKPIQKNDDAIDALRYLCMELRRENYQPPPLQDKEGYRRKRNDDDNGLNPNSWLRF